MNTIIFKVIVQGEPQQVHKQDGSVLRKCAIVLQEFGAFKDEGKVSATLIGEAAQKQWQPGDVVVARLRFTTHEYEGRTYQDTLVTGIMKINQ